MHQKTICTRLHRVFFFVFVSFSASACRLRDSYTVNSMMTPDFIHEYISTIDIQPSLLYVYLRLHLQEIQTPPLEDEDEDEDKN